MGHTNPEETVQNEISNYPGKISRRADRTWIKVCPNCFSINIRPLTNISGIIVQEQWYCPNCDYAGVVIEVKTEDLIRFRSQQIVKLYNNNRKVKTL